MINQIKNFLENKFDSGILLLRLFSGYLMIINHGYGKIMGGPEKWEKIGGAMELFGIYIFPTFWGFMASFSESVCAFLLIFGLFTVPSTFFLSITMFVAAYGHVIDGENAEKAFLFGAIFLSIMLTGSGRYSLDAKFFPHRVR